jgi:hypothetical protein
VGTYQEVDLYRGYLRKNMVYKAIISVVVILSLFTSIYPIHAVQQYNSTFYENQNKIWSQFFPVCAMANMLLVNVSTITYCHDVMQNYQNTLCQVPDASTHIDACKLGLIKNFMVTYNHDGNLGE